MFTIMPALRLPILFRLLAAVPFVAAALALAPYPVRAEGMVGPSGLPLPRFVSTRSAPINVRVGPGTKYDIAWKFEMPGLPVEITQEYDTWRKIRYVDGDEGWIHQSLLISRRTALVEPFGGAEKAALRTRAEDDAPMRAWLGAGLLVSIDSCSDGWCKIKARASENSASVSGEILQIELWGVYPDEDID